MAEIALVAEPRTSNGTRPSKRLRVAGRIPAIIYGHGDRPLTVSVDARELRLALSSEAGLNALFELSVGDERHLAIARELQRHPVRHTVAHVDFQVVRRDEIVPADVALHLVGEALGTTRAGGSIEHLVQSLHIHAKPADIPTSFELDISNLEIGDTVRLSEIPVPPGVVIDGDPEMTVVVAHPAVPPPPRRPPRAQPQRVGRAGRWRCRSRTRAEACRPDRPDAVARAPGTGARRPTFSRLASATRRRERRAHPAQCRRRRDRRRRRTARCQPAPQARHRIALRRGADRGDNGSCSRDPRDVHERVAASRFVRSVKRYGVERLAAPRRRP